MIKDSGNFIMLGAHNKSKIVWESFAHPGDTLLPGMKMRKGMKLTYWKSSMDPAMGLFSLGMDMSPGKTQMLLAYNNSVPYRTTGEWTANYFTRILELQDEEIIEMFCVRISPSRIYFNFTINLLEDNLMWLILVNEKGELYKFTTGRMMVHGIWVGPHLEVNEVSTISVGRMKCVMRMKFVVVPRASRLCMPLKVGGQAAMLDEDACNVLSQRVPPAAFGYLPEGEVVTYNNETTLEGCRTACLKNCSCTAFALSISDPTICRLRFGDLFKIRVSSDGQSVFIRLAASEFPHLTSEGGNKVPAFRVLFPAAAAVFSVVLGLVLAIIIVYKRRKLQMKSKEEDVPTSLKAFTYKELRIATQNFKHKLGTGAFG